MVQRYTISRAFMKLNKEFAGSHPIWLLARVQAMFLPFEENKICFIIYTPASEASREVANLTDLDCLFIIWITIICLCTIVPTIGRKVINSGS